MQHNGMTLPSLQMQDGGAGFFILFFHSLSYTPPPQALLAGWIHTPSTMTTPPLLQM